MEKKIRITWLKSDIGAIKDHRRTIRALGLRRLRQQVVKTDSPSIRGMAQSVIHMVKIEDVA